MSQHPGRGDPAGPRQTRLQHAGRMRPFRPLPREGEIRLEKFPDFGSAGASPSQHRLSRSFALTFGRYLAGAWSPLVETNPAWPIAV